jgi:threonine dehydratase
MSGHPEAALAVSLGDIEAAAAALDGAIVRTPFLPASGLSALTGAEILVKYENLQATGAYKERGALTRLLQLTPAERTRGVITMSAGNHAQAVAFHARRLGIPATVVMPVGTPFVKVGNSEALGATVVLAGETLNEASLRAETIGEDERRTFVHPYDDPLVIAGQGTIGLEIVAATPALDCLVVPIGGGGLIAGISVAVKAKAPAIEIIGVEAAAYPSMHWALSGRSGPVPGGQTLAEGIAVKTPGTLTLPVIRRHVSDILLVAEDAIERAIAAYLTLQRTMAEGAGAVGLAAVLDQPARFAGKRVGLVLTGGNIDPRMLASIALRGLEREGKMLALRIWLDDRPGALGRAATLIGGAGANIMEVWHQRLFLDVPAQGATVDIQIEVKDRLHAERVEAALKARGLRFVRLGTSGDGGTGLRGA